MSIAAVLLSLLLVSFVHLVCRVIKMLKEFEDLDDT